MSTSRRYTQDSSLKENTIEQQLKLVGVDYGITTGVAVVDSAHPFDVEDLVELHPKPGSEFRTVLNEYVWGAAGTTNELIVVMEEWPGLSSFSYDLYAQCFGAVQALGAKEVIQVPPSTWKTSKFVKNSSYEVPVALSNLHRSKHVRDAIGMARYYAHHLHTYKEN